MSELARFTITGGTEPYDKVAVTVEAGQPDGTPGDGFNVVEHYVNGSVQAVGWWADAISAMAYGAQHAGWPVKACGWDQVGDSRYWPGNTVQGVHRVPVVMDRCDHADSKRCGCG